MEKFKIWPYIFASLMGILVGMGTMDLIHRSDQSDVIKADADTTFNRVRLDSIRFAIGAKDTTIYKLNIKQKDDIEKSYQLSDSAAIDLFKQLSSGTDQKQKR